MNRRRLPLFLAGSWLCQLLAILVCSFPPVACAGGRLAIGGKSAPLSSRTAAVGEIKQEQANSNSNNRRPPDLKDAASTAHFYQQHEDLIRVHELVDAGSKTTLHWRGAKSASDLAPESQVVAVQFGERPLMYQTSLSQANRTKQAQEFDTHQEQQQASAGSTSGERPPPTPPGEAEVASTEPSTAVSTEATSAQDSATATSPPGWPLQTTQPTTTTTAAATTLEPTTSSGPVGVRIDREGDAVLCGEANANGKSNKRLALDRIVGGHKTEPGEFPFQVRLNIRSRRGSGICGGVVLDRWHVLTAAHCMTACVSHQLTTATIETSGVKATVGDHAIRSDDGELELEAASITPHERYDACNFYANDHDIALIKTAAPIPFKFTTDGYGSVNRPCMPANSSVQYRDGEMAIVSGWGVTRENSGALSNILRYVQVPIVNVTRCQETYGSRVTQDHVCAGFQAGGKDSCQGDSGGPLVRVVDNRYELVGIVSFGYGCGQAGAAGVYTKVASYLDWIKANTNDV